MAKHRFTPGETASSTLIALWTVSYLAVLDVSSAVSLRNDLQELAEARKIEFALVGLGAAGLLHQLDAEVRDRCRGNSHLELSSQVTNVYGSSGFNLPASGILWLGGHLGDWPGLSRAGGDLLRTLALTQMIVGPMKVIAHRERPDGSNRLSFPSGHTANAFAIARVIHRNCEGPVAVFPYVLGGMVGAGRIYSDRHYLSDVAMGAVVGILVGDTVKLQRRWGGNLSFVPGVDGGSLLSIRHRF